MTIFVKNIRRDKKLTVVYAFSNGVRIGKIITLEQLESDRAEGYQIITRVVLPKPVDSVLR